VLRRGIGTERCHGSADFAGGGTEDRVVATSRYFLENDVGARCLGELRTQKLSWRWGEIGLGWGMHFDLPMTIVVMGVSGAGKTEVGRAVAGLVDGVFEDADDFHSEEAKEKMRQGQALVDEDRCPWLERLRRRMVEVRGTGRRYVLACSALRAVYRERLRGEDGPEALRFVLLMGGRELIAMRMGRRQGHYMPLSLLDSQLAILERTEDLLEVGIEPTVEEIAAMVVGRLSEEGAGNE